MNADQFTPNPNAYLWLSPESVLFQLTEAIDFLHEALPDAALDHVTQPFKDNDATTSNAARFLTAIAQLENATNRVRLLFDMEPDTPPQPFAECWQQLEAIYKNHERAFTATHH